MIWRQPNIPLVSIENKNPLQELYTWLGIILLETSSLAKIKNYKLAVINKEAAAKKDLGKTDYSIFLYNIHIVTQERIKQCYLQSLYHS